MHASLRDFGRSTKGADLVEYALLCGVVALGALAALGELATAITNIFKPLVDGIGAILP